MAPFPLVLSGRRGQDAADHMFSLRITEDIVFHVDPPPPIAGSQADMRLSQRAHERTKRILVPCPCPGGNLARSSLGLQSEPQSLGFGS